MSRYFITPRDSSTGLKFQEIEKRSDECYEAARAIANKYKFHEWRGSPFHAWGGIASCRKFNDTPDPKIWGKGQGSGEYFPKRNTKAGKIVHTEIASLPTVSNKELNNCVGLSGSPFRCIGYSYASQTHYGFSTGEDWEFTPPADCTELTLPQYKEMFPSENKK